MSSSSSTKSELLLISSIKCDTEENYSVRPACFKPVTKFMQKFQSLKCLKCGEKSPSNMIFFYLCVYGFRYPDIDFFFNEIECKKGCTRMMQPLCISKDPCITEEKAKLIK